MDIKKVTTKEIQSASGKKPAKANSSNEKFTLDGPQPTTIQQNVALNPIDALFLTLNGSKKKYQKTVNHSHEILDQLEKLRLSIILGRIPKNLLEHITLMLEQQKNFPTEEPLTSLLQEIETRAKVELAKLEIAS